MPAFGVLVAVEGVEGAGKSTQAKALASAIGADLTREPGGTTVGEAVRALLLRPDSSRLPPLSELFLVLAARAAHVSEVIMPALSSGRPVVVDRFTGSTIAYQGYGRGLRLEDVRSACELAACGVVADLNVLLDIPIEAGTARRRESPDRIESESPEFHARVRAGFLAEAAHDPQHWVVIDGRKPKEVVTAEAIAAVVDRLGILRAGA